MITDFVQALKNKYVEQDDGISDQICIPIDKTIRSSIQLVGFGKVAGIQRQLRFLVSIDLSSHKINDAGPVNSLDDNLANIRIINLANNELNWSQLISLLECLPSLEELIITSNHLEDSHLDRNLIYPKNKFKHLTSLVIGRTHLDWQKLVGILSSIWSYITDLDLWDSQLNCDDMLLRDANENEISFIRKITSLRLNQNNFLRPSFLNYIGPVNNLRELDLSKCKMVSFVVDDLLAKNLENIVILNISYNDLVAWSDISTLAKLKRLRSLICHENPFYITAKVSNPLILGRIGTIDKLNRVEITRTFRRDSEIYYLRSILPEYRSFKKGTDIDFSVRHPRFNELAELYGLPEDPDDKKVEDKYLTLDFYFNDDKATKKIPRDMRVSNLRMLVKRLFKLSPSNAIRMTCCSHSDDGNEIQYDLDIDSQILSFYLNNDDKKIIISVVD